MRTTRTSGTFRQISLLLITAVLAVSGCTGTSASPDRGGTSPAAFRPVQPALSVTVASPANRATEVATSAEIALASNAENTTVVLTGPDGKEIPGTLVDGTRWVPGVQLDYDTAYTVRVTATLSGTSKTVTSSFTTMSRPSNTVGADLYVKDGDVVGVGFPLVVEFTNKSRLSAGPQSSGAFSWRAPRRWRAHGTGSAVRRCISDRGSTGHPEPKYRCGWALAV